jgi:methyl-accepting chemotaxis protein
MLYRVQTQGINFAKKERLGIVYQKPVEKLFRAISLHRLTYHAAALGDTESAQQLKSLNQEVINAFIEFKEVNQEIGEALEFTSAGLNKRGRKEAGYAAALAEWQKVVDTHNYEPLFYSLRATIAHLGDTSNLILDPDLDSYYLGDLVIGSLPQNQERIQEVLIEVEPMLVRGTLTNSERITTGIYYSMLKKVDYQRAVNSVQIALNEDINFYGLANSLQKNMPLALLNYRTSAEKFHNQLERITFSASAPSRDEFLTAGREYFENSYSLWSVAAVQLDLLLQQRISELSHERALSLTIVLIVLLLSCGFAIQVSRSVNKTLVSVIISSEKIYSSESKLSSFSAEPEPAPKETDSHLKDLN